MVQQPNIDIFSLFYFFLELDHVFQPVERGDGQPGQFTVGRNMGLDEDCRVV